jgi:hypothetical protein
MKPIEVARNPNANTSGNEASPIQYAAIGAATHVKIPANVAGL